MGSVFVYLRGKSMTGKEMNICYYRAHAYEFIDKDPQIKWVEFIADPAIA